MDHQYPDWCYIRMFNLSNDTSNSMFKKGAGVELQAGYEKGSFGLIFRGVGQQQRRGKLPNGVDKYHDVVATGPRSAFQYGTVNKTLNEDWTLKDAWETATQVMQQLGASIGFVDKLPETKFKKPITLYGMARDVMNWVANTANMSWHYDHEGKINLIKNDGFMQGDTMVINADTGMVGLPEQTLDGINVKIFLNPNVRKGQKVMIDEKSIQRLQFGRGVEGANVGLFGGSGFGDQQLFDLNVPQVPGTPQVGTAPRITTDNIYKVIKIDHDGSMEGQEWYTTLICIALDESGPASAKFGGAGDANSERGTPEKDSQQQGGGGGGQ